MIDTVRDPKEDTSANSGTEFLHSLEQVVTTVEDSMLEFGISADTPAPSLV